jgi:hypothetical protein
MGLWNTHGMADDDELVQDAIDALSLNPGEMAALVEYNRGEQWVWQQVARRTRGQDKRQANLIVKHLGFRMEKWIDLVAKLEVEYEQEYGAFKEVK